MLQSMGLQRDGYDLVTELTELCGFLGPRVWSSAICGLLCLLEHPLLLRGPFAWVASLDMRGREKAPVWRKKKTSQL